MVSVEGSVPGISTSAPIFASVPMAVPAVHSDPAASSAVSFSDPFYVAYNEVANVSLVANRLKNETNFIKWRKQMEIALACKSKLDFVRGKFPKPTDPDQLQKWERCNNFCFQWIICSVSDEIADALLYANTSIDAWNFLMEKFSVENEPRIFNIKQQISSLRQGDLTLAAYHDKFTHLWGEEDSFNSKETCVLGLNCKSNQLMSAKWDTDKLMQFLMGLNDDYVQV